MVMRHLAPLRDTVSLYCHIHNSKVLLIKENYKHIVIDRETFYYLYYEVDAERAALKEDCVHYTVYQRGIPLSSYPEWFIEAYDNGYIYEEEGYEDLIIYNIYGDVVLDPGFIVLRNFKGELYLMVEYTFTKYYDVIVELSHEYYLALRNGHCNHRRYSGWNHLCN